MPAPHPTPSCVPVPSLGPADSDTAGPINAECLPNDPPNHPPTGAPDGPGVGGAVPFRGKLPWRPDAPWRVATWVEPADVLYLEDALGASAVVVPCDSLDAFTAAVRGGAAAAVVGSACVAKADTGELLLLGMQSPTTVFLGLHADPAASSGTAALRAAGAAMSRLQRAGIAAVCHPDDAHRPLLQRTIACGCLADPVQRACVALVLRDVRGAYRTGEGGPTELGLLRFFAAAFAPGLETVVDVATYLGEEPGVLRARFLQSGLPGADRYVAAARLVRAAWTGSPAGGPGGRPGSGPGREPVGPGTPTAAWLAAVATAVRPAHPEAPAPIRRAVRRLRRVTARGVGVPPGQAAGILVLDSYRVALVLPFLDALRAFDPSGATEA